MLKDLLAKAAEIKKALVALVVGVCGWIGVVLASAPAEITAEEKLAFAVVLLQALGVWQATNKPPA